MLIGGLSRALILTSWSYDQGYGHQKSVQCSFWKRLKWNMTASIRADTLVLAVGMKTQRELLDNLEGKVPSAHAIGDCVEPRNILNAIWEACRIAQHI